MKCFQNRSASVVFFIVGKFLQLLMLQEPLVGLMRRAWEV